MRITFYGVRGSFPVAHPNVSRVGGNTSCVALRAEGAPTIIFDAGTGLRTLGRELMDEGFGDGVGQGAFFFSHTHWDHIQGFMFFEPFFKEGNEFGVYARASHDNMLHEVFASQQDDPYFGYGLSAFGSDVKWNALQEGQSFQLGPYKISTCRLNHPGIAVGYRVDLPSPEGNKSFVYLTDTAPYDDQLLGEGFHRNQPDQDPLIIAKIREHGRLLEEFVSGTDILLYDTFFTPEQYAQNPHWGHSTADEGIRLCRQGSIPRFVNFHHHPEAWDDVLEERVKDYQNRQGGSEIEVLLAREGESLEI